LKKYSIIKTIFYFIYKGFSSIPLRKDLKRQMPVTFGLFISTIISFPLILLIGDIINNWNPEIWDYLLDNKILLLIFCLTVIYFVLKVLFYFFGQYFVEFEERVKEEKKKKQEK